MNPAGGHAQEVSSDQPCVRCGYSLRGLSTGGACPECATPVERSLLGDRLVFSDPEYVQTLRRGAWLVFAGTTSLFLLPLLAGLSRALVAGHQTSLDGLTLAMSGLFLWGWWWMTRPDAGQLASNRGEKPRRWTRIAVVVLVFTKVGIFVVPHVVALDDVLCLLMRMLDRMALCLGVAAGMEYIRWLSERMPSEEVQKRATGLLKVLRFLAWAIVTCYVTLLVEKFGTGIGPDSVGGKVLRLVEKLSRSVVGWGAAYGFLVLLFLFNRIRKELTRISKAQQGPAAAASGFRDDDDGTAGGGRVSFAAGGDRRDGGRE